MQLHVYDKRKKGRKKDVYIYSYFKKGWWRFCCMLHLAYQARNALWAMWMESAKGHNNYGLWEFSQTLSSQYGAGIFSSVCACWHYLSMIHNTFRAWYTRCNKTFTNIFWNSCIQRCAVDTGVCRVYIKMWSVKRSDSESEGSRFEARSR